MESPNSNHQGDTDPEGQNNFWCSTAGSWDSAYEDHPSLDLRKVHDLLPDVKLLLTHLIDAGSSLILPRLRKAMARGQEPDITFVSPHLYGDPVIFRYLQGGHGKGTW